MCWNFFNLKTTLLFLNLSFIEETKDQKLKKLKIFIDIWLNYQGHTTIQYQIIKKYTIKQEWLFRKQKQYGSKNMPKVRDGGQVHGSCTHFLLK